MPALRLLMAAVLLGAFSSAEAQEAATEATATEAKPSGQREAVEPVTIEEGVFGKTADGQVVKSWTLSNAKGMRVTLISLGATIQSLHVPDAEGNTADVVLGFDDVAGYQSDANPYFGCTVGRYANRIAGASFDLDGQTYDLLANNGEHHLHGGGENALARKVWKGRASSQKSGAGTVTFRATSPDGEEGYPGQLEVTVRFTLEARSNALVIQYTAESDAPTPVNLTNHSYFNLHGHDGESIRDHVLKLNAARYTVADDSLIPTGQFASVQDTPYDFQRATAIGKRLDDADGGPKAGYDLNYVINPRVDDSDNPRKLNLVAIVRDRDTGRMLTCQSDQPGVQLYTGNFMGGIAGKNGATYEQYGAFCLETQHFPDSVHHDNFPSVIVKPGEPLKTRTRYVFSTYQPQQRGKKNAAADGTPAKRKGKKKPAAE